jgi:hypothetical protein
VIPFVGAAAAVVSYVVAIVSALAPAVALVFAIVRRESGSGKYLNWVITLSPRVNEIQGVIRTPTERSFGSEA